MDFLTWFALGLIIFVVLTFAYGLIAIHDVPYHIAKGRNHPHQDAIHTAGWVSLFTLHAIWPFLWIWASSYHPEHGYRGQRPGEKSSSDAARLAGLEERVKRLEAAAQKPPGA
ncbi:MAG: DUF3302 domain-containing protein [Chthoniobacterales bacterium]|nr:DUF3302 domain-containing protein [Chthoniobacterales bacterium]